MRRRGRGNSTSNSARPTPPRAPIWRSAPLFSPAPTAFAASCRCRRRERRRGRCRARSPRRSPPAQRRSAGSARPIWRPICASSASRRKRWPGFPQPSCAPAMPRSIEQAMSADLLDRDEPAPVMLVNEGGRSPFFLVCDHAGNRIPRRLGTLGLQEAERQRHIAWDIGIAAVGRALSSLLDATLILQTYSRLVIDCNRDPAVASSIPAVSELTEIPGNVGLDAQARAARIAAIFRPYHDCIAAALDRRAAAR